MKPIRKKVAKATPDLKKTSSKPSAPSKEVCFSLITVSAQEREAYRVPTYGYLLP